MRNCIGWTRNRWSRLLAAVLALVAFGVYLHVEAGQERYDYDGLGRLIRRVDSQSRATEYVYDAAGNIVRVTAGTGAVQAPSISQVTPISMRRGETRQVTIIGANLTGVGVSTDTAALDIYDVHANPTQVSFTLTASPNTSIGAHAIRLTSAAGSAATSINVAPVLPKLTVEPTPLAIPPDGVTRQITLRLSGADTIAHTIALSASSAKITVSPAQLTFQAGQTTATMVVTGVSAGTANILTSSATLGASGVPVYVTADFRGISTSHASSLGVILEAPPSSTDKTISPIVSRILGIAVGNYVAAMAPTAFVVGGSGQLTISGTGLNTAAAVAVVPNTGVTLGAAAAAPDGKTLNVPIAVAANAALGPRQVIVTDGTGKAFAVSQPNIDRITVVRAGPEIHSIDPLFATRGTTQSLTVRGRNLQDAQFSIAPNVDMAVGNDPVINADGTEARLQVSAGLTAALSDYAIVATTPGGSSSAALSANNTLRVVNEIRDAVTPITSLPVGVVLQDSTAAVSRSSNTYSRLLGVSVGTVITGISPAVGIVGTSVTLTLQGANLHGVTSVQLNPATGITIGSITLAPDGKSLRADLTIAPDAPRTGRVLNVLAGTASIPFSDPAAAQFLVTAPLPTLASIAPNAIQRGLAAQTLTISGSNFKDTSAVLVLPPDNLTVSPPTVNADANQITITIAAAANAAVGPRTVVVVTPAGQSSSAAVAANTLTIARTATLGPSPLVSGTLGVVLGSTPPTPATDFLVSPNLGLVLQTVPISAQTQGEILARLGVALGPVTTAIEPAAFAPGTTSVLTVRGSGLQQVNAAIVEPAEGITIGSVTASADGSSVTAPIIVAAGAQALLPRRVRVSAAGTAIPDARPAAMTFQVGPGIPQFDSISPILAKQGDKLTLTIRGQNLAGAIAVTSTPLEGIVVSNTLSIDAAGTLTVDLYVSPEAPLGPRVIRAWVPGAASDEVAAPANTFTVYAP